MYRAQGMVYAMKKGRLIKTSILLAVAALLCVPGVIGYKNGAVAVNSMADSKKIALTFDDGPHPYYTEQLLDGLKERGVHATFFVMGKHVELYP